MKVLIDIPTKNFGVDITNKFQDFFQRLQVETKAHLISNTNDLCGNYELETIKMFLNAFEKMQIIPDDATNGDMIKAMFPSLEIANDKLINDNLTGIMAFYCGYDSPLPRGDNYFNRKWWNAPYEEKRGNEK